MNVPHLNIQSQHAQIGLQQHQPEMSIKQRGADLRIDQELVGTLRISTTASRLYIDQSEAFADADLKGPLRRGKEWGTKGKQSVLEYIAKTARDGERLKKIENGTNVLSELARESGQLKVKEAHFTMVPKDIFRVRFDYVPSDVRISVDWPDPQIEVRRNDPDIRIPKWQSKVYLQQKNWIAFSVEGSTISKQL
nr:DUF6470 family protein [Evansella caseinilytica]